MDFTSCLEKQTKLLSRFASCSNEEDVYKKIIELGREAKPLDPKHRTEENIVPGCQSTVYLHAQLKDGVVFFEAESDAMISSGLAEILIHVYSGERPESILKCPPDYLEKLGIHASLTPSRANGLYSIHLKMQQEALRLYTLSITS